MSYEEWLRAYTAEGIACELWKRLKLEVKDVQATIEDLKNVFTDDENASFQKMLDVMEGKI